MKKVIFTLAIALAAANLASAQKGSILLYGNITYSHSSNTNSSTTGVQSDKSTALSIAPGIGYQFSDNWTVGLNLGYAHTGNSYTTSTTQTSDVDQYIVGPFLRYSRPLTSWVSLYGQFDAEYQLQGKTYQYSTEGNQQHQLFFDVYPALFFPVKNGFGLNVSFGGVDYASSRVSGISGTKGSTFNLTFGQAAMIGVSKNFGGHKAAAKS